MGDCTRPLLSMTSVTVWPIVVPPSVSDVTQPPKARDTSKIADLPPTLTLTLLLERSCLLSWDLKHQKLPPWTRRNLKLFPKEKQYNTVGYGVGRGAYFRLCTKNGYIQSI